MPEWAANDLGAATISPSNRGQASFVRILALIALRLMLCALRSFNRWSGVNCTILHAAAMALLVNDGRNC